MDITFINSTDKSFIKVGSNKNIECDVYITNFIDIIESAEHINNKLSKLKTISFDIQHISKEFVKAFLNRIIQGLYQFNKYKTTNGTKTTVNFYAPQISIQQKNDIINMLSYANISRNLLNEPSNKSSPEYFCNTVNQMFKNIPNITVKILNHQHIKQHSLGLIDAIGNSSANKPRVLIIEYEPLLSPKNTKTICLVGKGVTIDTGGYSLKPKQFMYNMHMDKTGASICVGLMKAVIEKKYKNKVISVIPLVENIVSDSSIKPGDVVKAYNGQSVEIVDVDAEGRLILADALSYVCKNYEPNYIFDFATLTGWSANIHCHTSFTFFTLNNTLSKYITHFGELNAERSYQMPAWTEYIHYLKSDKADIKNYGFKCSNSDGFMASIFLMNFIPNIYRKNWVHFDIKTTCSVNTLGIADGFSTFLDILEKIQ